MVFSFGQGTKSNCVVAIENYAYFTTSNGLYIVDISKKEGLAEGISEIDGGVTVHHACHARAQNMGNKARDMLKLIPNIKMDIVERCAGHGGTFGVMKATYDIANKFGKITAGITKKKNGTLFRKENRA